MPKKWLYACMPVSGAIMMIYSVKNMVLELDGVLHPARADGGGTGEGAEAGRSSGWGGLKERKPHRFR